jgi:glycosyltransferase involved in cell wall biosynthesis
MNGTAPAPPKVSVLITTYKHEKFIAQTIESALMQETRFPFEIVIGEDCSPDDTRRIVEAYQRDHPDTIRLIARERNLSSGNFVATYAECRGTYVAILEGDDYWTSSDKLQSQADALDAHPEWVLCFHTVRIVRDDRSKPPHAFPQLEKEAFTLDDILKKNFIPTCSVMFRNGVIGQFPEWYFSLPIGDWPLFIMLAQHGELGYLNRVMADYRRHSEGLWTRMDDFSQAERSLETLGQMRQLLDSQRRARLTDQIVVEYITLAAEHFKHGHVSKAFSTVWGLLRRESVLRRGFPHRRALRTVLESGTPRRMLRLLRWVRR